MNGAEGEAGRLKGLIEARLAGFLPDDGANSRALREAMLYTLGAPGKRIRPLLLLLACKAVRGSEEDAMPYACAVEFIHNYSLIHDDLPAMDDDELRRGEPTNHVVFGEAMAILAGDGLLSAAFELMHEDYMLHLDDLEALGRRVRAGMAIAAGCGRRGMVAGQAADIGAEGKAEGHAEGKADGKELSAGLLEFIHLNKTAALLRAAVEAGAEIGGAGPETVRALSLYGENLGLAFQIVDDILDCEGETAVIGKTAGKDAEAKKLTYPGVYGALASRERLAELTEKAVDALEGAADTDAFYIGILADMARGLAVRGK